jgi:two-component system OmpR family sensor kinase
VRWRLAVVSASLTLVILVGFALVVGRLATQQFRDDYRDELRSAAGELAFEIQVSGHPGLSPGVRAPNLQNFAMADRASVRLISSSGQVIQQTPNSPNLGTPQPGVQRFGDYEVATAPVATNRVGLPAVYVQYARDHNDLEGTIGRLWLFLGCGVLVGTLLATFAGLAVAGRAMRPIASLTAATREIASTRDPSRRIPRPETEDEVAELAGTLDQMLQSLDAARTEREQAMDRQREFVADASHELRTPLTSILANLELLQASLEGDAGDEDREAVTSALRSSKRMGRLVGDLLQLARADAGRSGPRRDCDLREIATTALSEVEPMASAHRISLDCDASVPVDGNPDELHRMVVNLLDNAVQHTPDGTEIRLSVAATDGEAQLEVSDDGPGLPPGLEEQIFDRFVRGIGPADMAGRGGTGLGLAIVKAVANAHGGDVAAGPSARGGARFTVHLPLASSKGEPAPALTEPS